MDEAHDVPVLKSPVSGVPMVEVTIMDVPLFKDPETGGYWVRLEALQALAAMQETPLEEIHTGETLQQHQGRFCPEDGAGLMEFEFEEHSGVKLDVCPACNGVWLDAGEITGLLDYLEDYEFGDHTPHEEHLGLTERVLLFLYNLTARPPLY